MHYPVAQGFPSHGARGHQETPWMEETPGSLPEWIGMESNRFFDYFLPRVTPSLPAENLAFDIHPTETFATKNDAGYG